MKIEELQELLRALANPMVARTRPDEADPGRKDERLGLCGRALQMNPSV
jgi:hypothetical protein